MTEETKHTETSEAENISITNPFIWIIGAVILLLIGWFSVKTLFFNEEGYRVSLVDAPKEAFAGSTTTFTWRVDGAPTTINHTSVHYSLTSNPGDLGKDVKPADTKYTDLVKDFANGTFNIPLQFVGNTVIPAPGKYYFRVHAIIKDKNYWSDEYTLDVKQKEYSIVINSKPPENVIVGQPVNFVWTVDGLPTSIISTSVYYGLVSSPGTLGKEVSPNQTEYTEYIKDFYKGSYKIPLQFVTSNAKVEVAGKYYYRFHALVNGQNIWSDEFSFTAVKESKGTVTVTVVPSPSVSPTATQ